MLPQDPAIAGIQALDADVRGDFKAGFDREKAAGSFVIIAVIGTDSVDEFARHVADQTFLFGVPEARARFGVDFQDELAGFL